jgi:hypothetical protein
MGFQPVKPGAQSQAGRAAAPNAPVVVQPGLLLVQILRHSGGCEQSRARKPAGGLTEATTVLSAAQIVAPLDRYYRTNHPNLYSKRLRRLTASFHQVKDIYLRNVFPAMKVTWGTYPDNIGHMNAPGCFRCHDGSHTDQSGKVITQDCSAYHALLAVEEQNPQILTQLEIRTPGAR